MLSRGPFRMQATAGALFALGVMAGIGPAAAQPLNIQPPKEAAAPARPRPVRLPPVRPEGLGLPRDAAASPSSAVQTASAEAQPVTPRTAATPAKATSPKAALPATQEDAIERLNAYLNSFTTLQGDFIQFASDGRRLEGKLYIQRPGKMRFEYRPPVTTEVIADGTSVAVRDKRLATQDLYSIGQTPLKFLVRERIDLTRESAIAGAAIKDNILSVRMEDRSTLGGTSKITLNFDLVSNELKQWIVVDPQGYETSVALYNLDTQRRPDPKNFVINYERVL